MTTVRYTWQGQENATGLASQGVQDMGNVSDSIVTSGKTTLAGLGEDNEGAAGLINANSQEFERAQIQLDAAQTDLRTDEGSRNIHEGVAGRVRSALGG